MSCPDFTHINSGLPRSTFHILSISVNINFTLEQAMKSKWWSRVVTLLSNLGARWEWVVNATPRPLYPQKTDAIPITQEAGCAPGRVWTCAENFPLTAFKFIKNLKSCGCTVRSSVSWFCLNRLQGGPVI
jgi:hypothetical protein